MSEHDTAVSVVVTGTGPDLSATVASVLGQTLAGVQAVLDSTALEPPASGEWRDDPRVAVGGEPAGEYLMFVRAGQVLDRHGCLTLLSAAERGTAQIVCGDADRFPASRLYRRDLLSDLGLWPVEDEHAAKAVLMADRVLVLPHEIVRYPGGHRPAGRPRRRARLLDVERLKRVAYRQVLMRLPVRQGSAVFESHGGRAYGGCPRAIYEELRASGHRGRITWAYTGSPDGFPGGADLVERFSWAHYRALARARYWVDDHGLPPTLAKRPETVYLQTWHGAPVEYTGLDAPAAKLASRAARKSMRRAAARFDYFVVGSAYEEETLVPALGVRAELLRVGRPGNDLLVEDREPDRVRRLAWDLGLDGRPCVLYAPRGPAADLGALAAALGDDVALLARCEGAARPGTWTDVSRVHDLATLLRLADVLVTDRSPLLFRYALLDRPMIFHAPDLAGHRHRHGAYLDLAAEAPGPFVADLEELSEAVRARAEIAERYRDARRAFAARYAGYETGAAAETIVRRVFQDGG
ncbi:CDP-glycerol glycerophosphotransferase family protein [Actinomadura macrotermitis]|uniref:Uncharacterized protein n=1 Tax=Actinomadura macrotermitis TaxID=2585200 RepID=A0A7K0C219_9ACTN|nr:CDP-glycerol glycerophosphotransferase family protein [Actinomadura macrotermitis]MQY07511.1 hypothetical protein [Actinomadura macrotermitis]